MDPKFEIKRYKGTFSGGFPLFFLSNHIEKWFDISDLSNRPIRASKIKFYLTVQNSEGHLSISAGACSEHLEMAEKKIMFVYSE